MLSLRVVAEGRATVQTTDRLFASKRTAETHRQNRLAKTSCKNTASPVGYAITHQLLLCGSPARSQ